MQAPRAELAVVALLLIGVIEEASEIVTGYWLASLWLVLLLGAEGLAVRLTRVRGRTLLPLWVAVLVFFGSTEILGGFLAGATISGPSTVVASHPLLALAVVAVVGAFVLDLVVLRGRLTTSSSTR